MDRPAPSMVGAGKTQKKQTSLFGAALQPPHAAPAGRCVGARARCHSDGVRAGTLRNQTAHCRGDQTRGHALVPLVLPPGHVSNRRASAPAGTALARIPARARLPIPAGLALAANHATKFADRLTLKATSALPPREGLVHFEFCRGVRIADWRNPAPARPRHHARKLSGEVTAYLRPTRPDSRLVLRSRASPSRHTRSNAATTGIQSALCVGHDGGPPPPPPHVTRQPDRCHATPARRIGSTQRQQRIPRRRRDRAREHRSANARFRAFAATQLDYPDRRQPVTSREVAPIRSFAFEGTVIAQNLVGRRRNRRVSSPIHAGRRLAVVRQHHPQISIRQPQPAGPRTPAHGNLCRTDTTVTGTVSIMPATRAVSLVWPFPCGLGRDRQCVRQAGMRYRVAWRSSRLPIGLIFIDVLTGVSPRRDRGIDHARRHRRARQGRGTPHASLSIAGTRVG